MQYVKNFSEWGKRKAQLNFRDRNLQSYEKQIWVTSVGTNIGNEIDGKGQVFARPVLVIKRCNATTFIGVPLTKTTRKESWSIPCKVNGVNGSINITQIRLFDQKRLLRLTATLRSSEFKKIKTAIVEFLK